MLCAGHDHATRLPQSDLVYCAFRLCFFNVAESLDLQRDSDSEVQGDDPDEPMGFLAWNVPFFSTVLPIVQLDLLAALWRKHHARRLHEIYLAEAAVLYAICHDAGRIATEVWEGDLSIVMNDGPRSVRQTRVHSKIKQQLADLFDDFWDDEDFLLIEFSQDGVPFQQTGAGWFFGIPDEWIDEMYEILGRAKPRPTMLDDLTGLLTSKERASFRFLLDDAG